MQGKLSQKKKVEAIFLENTLLLCPVKPAAPGPSMPNTVSGRLHSTCSEDGREEASHRGGEWQCAVRHAKERENPKCAVLKRTQEKK